MFLMCKFGIIPEDKFGGEAYIFYLFCTLLAPHSSLGVVLPVMVMYYETGCSFLIRNGWVLSIASPSLEKMHTNKNYGFNPRQHGK